MNKNFCARHRPAEYAWPLVLCLVGVDYFSTLAYLPSIAVSAAGPWAPFAGAGVVAVTFLLAVPVYWYIIGRCGDGRGAAGLIEKQVPGWRGKLLVLTLLGFAAVDFVITRSLSLADASIHIIRGPWAGRLTELLPLELVNDQLARVGAPTWWAERIGDPQVITTVLLSLISLGLWQLLKHGESRGALYVTAAAVLFYLGVVAVVLASGCRRLAENPHVTSQWWRSISGASHATSWASDPDWLWTLGGVVLSSFPQLALGLSGFEMIMTLSPRVKGKFGRRGRVRNMRVLMLTLATVMGVLLPIAVGVTTLLTPLAAMSPGGAAEHRALAYLAHGGALSDGMIEAASGLRLGAPFAAAFDAATVLILCLAGVSVTMSVQTLLPHYLNRLGMDVVWAGRVGGVLLTLHGVALALTFIFEAGPTSQQAAYAASVLALLAGAALAAFLDLRAGATRGWQRFLLTAVSTIGGSLFATMAVIAITSNYAGLAIPVGFIAAILLCSFCSRLVRSTELRFRGFQFADDASRGRWDELRSLPEVVLVPHRPGLTSPAAKRDLVRREFRVETSRSLLVVEVELGDPSDFLQRPLMRIGREGDVEVMCASKCVSVAHVLAAIALELGRSSQTRVEMIFGWSKERPVASNLNFLLFGEGNIPWMVKDLVEQAEPLRRPRILLG